MLHVHVGACGGQSPGTGNPYLSVFHPDPQKCHRLRKTGLSLWMTITAAITTVFPTKAPLRPGSTKAQQDGDARVEWEGAKAPCVLSTARFSHCKQDTAEQRLLSRKKRINNHRGASQNRRLLKHSTRSARSGISISARTGRRALSAQPQ